MIPFSQKGVEKYCEYENWGEDCSYQGVEKKKHDLPKESLIRAADFLLQAKLIDGKE